VELSQGADYIPFVWRNGKAGANAFKVEFGLSLYKWGDNPIADLSRVSTARPGGYGGQVVVGDDVFVRSSNERELDAVLDAQDAGATLADYESVRELLAYMDVAGAHSVLLFRALEIEVPAAVPANNWPSLAELDEAIASRPKLAPYEFFALVIGTSEGTNLLTLAVLNESEVDAAENTNRLRAVMDTGLRINAGPDARWVDLFDGDAPSYDTVGPLSLATFEALPDRGVYSVASSIERDVIRWYDDL